jgi:P-type Mg2+ transporter
MKFSECTTKNVKEVFGFLQTSDRGISLKEAQERLKKCGLNEVKGKETTLIDILIRQFKSSFIYLLFVAAIIAFLIGERVDAFVILVFVLINVCLGFFQEAKAQRAIVLLRKYFPSKVRVIRNGREKTIEKNLLVPGDVVLLEQGDVAPADLRIFKSDNLLVDETVLTGESVPISKFPGKLEKEAKEVFEAKNIIFAGTSIISGEAEAVVISTGKEMVMGEISKLVSKISKESVYEKQLLKLSSLVLKIVIITIVFAFLANIYIKGTVGILDYLLFCIALIVSIIPEALPLIFTFALSSGALKLAEEKVVVRRLSAVEGLGDIEILCTDKTGTLTENKLKIHDVYSQDKDKCLLYGLLSSSYIDEEIESSLNPFDSAIYQKASKKIRESLKKYKVISEASFDLSRLRNSVFLRTPKKENVIVVKGAPEIILKLCSKLPKSRRNLKQDIEKEGERGKRVLAVAFKKLNKESFSKKDEKNMEFLGYFSFSDPLKKTTKEAIQLSKNLGVKVKIITGDSKEVAGSVAEEIGLIGNAKEVITGEKLDSLSQKEFEKACEDFFVFARISPEIKYRIVDTLAKKYEVGFLGEGINDAPALKSAHLGIAVQSASDVSREVSDIILLKKDLKIIVNGIKQGRNIFSNINKYIKCTLASNFGNFYSIALISLAIPYLPMLPIQILLVNLLSDFPLVSVASDAVDAKELKKPKFYQLNRVIVLIVVLGLISTIFDFIFFAIFYKVQPSLLQTLWFIESILTEIVLIFSIRTSNFFLKAKAPSFSLVAISVFIFLITVGLPFTGFGQETFHFVVPPATALSIVLGLIMLYFIISEMAKLIYFHYYNKKYTEIL